MTELASSIPVNRNVAVVCSVGLTGAEEIAVVGGTRSDGQRRSAVADHVLALQREQGDRVDLAAGVAGRGVAAAVDVLPGDDGSAA